MSRKYVILHSPDMSVAGSRSLVRGAAMPKGPFARRSGSLATGQTAAPKVETESMVPARAREMAQKNKVAAIAPVIPMRLVAPVATRAVPEAAAADESPWGLDAVGALTTPFDGNGIVVAVLDTGVDPRHEAFGRPGLEIERRNFTDAGPDDEDGHGTHCAGTIFGGTVGGKRIGVAPGVSKAMIGKVLGGDGGGSDRIAEAVQWAVTGGAHVISMSLGMDFPGYVAELLEDGVPPELATSIALEGYRANILLFERLASFISARGMLAQPTLLIAAAGNESRRDQSADFEIAVSPPAVSDGFLSVAALGKSTAGLVVAPFSNSGARISAPGVDIVSARRGGGLVSMDGTSMATPHVAGVAALWAQKLFQENALTGPLWTTRLLGSGRVDALKVGFEPNAVGSGMVRAPRVG